VGLAYHIANVTKNSRARYSIAIVKVVAGQLKLERVWWIGGERREGWAGEWSG